MLPDRVSNPGSLPNRTADLILRRIDVSDKNFNQGPSRLCHTPQCISCYCFGVAAFFPIIRIVISNIDHRWRSISLVPRLYN